MPYFSDLAATMARRRRKRGKKLRTKEELDAIAEVQAPLIEKIDGLIRAQKAKTTQGAILGKADLTVEMLRKWRKGTSSPTLRSLVLLLKVVERRLLVEVAATADGAIVGVNEEGTMPDDEDDELRKKIDLLPEIDHARVESFVEGLRMKNKPHPPELAEGSPGSRPPGQPK